jgi:hypothetical protein
MKAKKKQREWTMAVVGEAVFASVRRFLAEEVPPVIPRPASLFDGREGERPTTAPFVGLNINVDRDAMQRRLDTFVNDTMARAFAQCSPSHSGSPTDGGPQDELEAEPRKHARPSSPRTPGLTPCTKTVVKGDKPMNKVPYIDIKEFYDFGYLQEVNRRFLHPLGMALSVVLNEDGTVELGGIMDCRDDPEGVIFSPNVLNAEKYRRVEAEWYRRVEARIKAGGYHIQPVETPETDAGPKRS